VGSDRTKGLRSLLDGEPAGLRGQPYDIAAIAQHVQKRYPSGGKHLGDVSGLEIDASNPHEPPLRRRLVESEAVPVRRFRAGQRRGQTTREDLGDVVEDGDGGHLGSGAWPGKHHRVAVHARNA
jgi:hypothetical protein